MGADAVFHKVTITCPEGNSPWSFVVTARGVLWCLRPLPILYVYRKARARVSRARCVRVTQRWQLRFSSSRRAQNVTMALPGVQRGMIDITCRCTAGAGLSLI